MSDPAFNLRGAVDLSGLVARAATQHRQPSESPESSRLSFTIDDSGIERMLALSDTVPVLVEFVAPGIEPALAPVVERLGGRMAHAVVDATTSPQLAGAFQVRQVPTLFAVVAGRPVPIAEGIPEARELAAVLDQVLQLAAQNGVTGRIDQADADTTAAEGAEAKEPQLPPHHQEAYEAITRGDFAAAAAEYRAALAQNPRDTMASAGLAQVSLLQRVAGADAAAVRAAASDAADVDAQLAAADLDVAGGRPADAFERLLACFPALPPEGRDAVRLRMLEYFELLGADDSAVAAARRRLTALLY